MAIAGIAVGATKGFVYIRSEYPHAIEVLRPRDRHRARGRACLGAGIARLDLRFRSSRSASAPAPMSAARRPRCSTASKASAARCAPSRRCRRIRACSASRPSINNVISLASVPVILADGADAYRDLGMGRSRGTMPIQLAGNVKHGGLFEAGVRPHAGRARRRYRRRHAQRAGRCARCRSAARSAPISRASLFDTPFDYEAFAAQERADRPWRRRGVRRHRRHGAAGALRDGVLRDRILRQMHALPHRLDARRRGDRQASSRGERRAENLALLRDLCDTMKFGSLCALGGFMPYPVMSALTHFPEDFGARPPAPPRRKEAVMSLDPARSITARRRRRPKRP